MRCYLHIIPKDPALDRKSDEEQIIREVVSEAPGILEVSSIDLHSHGGYSVIVDRADALPDDFSDYFTRSGLSLVI